MRKTLREWLTEYAQSHQNKTNQLVHNIFVPLITFSILGIFWSITPWLLMILVVIAMGFYLSISVKYAIAMLIAAVLMLYILAYLSYRLEICIAIFVVSWIFQFIGHNIEGKKPSFFKDMQFLLVGPLWVLSKLVFKDKIGFNVEN
jgi:uncharacterized membrane protein YGL010W